jgi:acetylornithine deacetylase/succinyl-diaminopimelate desuccinylase family protein
MPQEASFGRASRIHDAVRARSADLVQLTRSLVRYRSENPKLMSDPEGAEAGRRQEEACQDHVASLLGNLGMRVDRWEVLPGRYDVVGTLPGQGSGRSLILNGHVDVVPAGDPAEWSHDPWGGELFEGLIWGRGSVDMKGGLACGIVALEVLRELGVQLAGDVILQSVVDEETGGPGTRACIERGYRADGAIFMEPTSLAILPVEGGLEWLRLVVRGVSGHSAVRYKSVHAGGRGTAVNAIEKMAKLLAAIQELERHRGNTLVHPLLPAGLTTINPGAIMGGSGGGEGGIPRTVNALSNMADYCSLGLSLKYLPQERVEDVKQEFEQYIADVARTDPWLRDHPPEIEWGVLGVSFPPAEVPLDHPLVQTLASVHQEVIGKPPVVEGMAAVTDMAWTAQAGIPGLIYGPGDAGVAHGSGEFISLDEMLAGTEATALMLSEWCGAVR